MLAIILILDSVGLLNEKTVSAIDIYDQWLGEGNDRLQVAFKLLEQLQSIDDVISEEE